MSKAQRIKPVIGIKSQKIVRTILEENPKIKELFSHAKSTDEVNAGLKAWVLSFLSGRDHALSFYEERTSGRKAFEKLEWQEIAAIRILDYISNEGRTFEDLNLRGEIIINQPFGHLWDAANTGRSFANDDYFYDMLQLLRQFSGKLKPQKPARELVEHWMSRHQSGLESKVVKMRQSNKMRILGIIIQRLEQGVGISSRYYFDEGMTREQKYERALQWWDTSHFHLKFAIRTPELLNEMLDHSLSQETLELMEKARLKKIPVFVNPYYLSLLNVDAPSELAGADLAIRDYVFMSEELVEEYGHIVAWEKEDIVEPGKPNAAGWILPSYRNIHRRYPEVAILIPDTAGRTCGGLCVSCQRMYEFQSGHLNFNLESLAPRETWPLKLKRLMSYFEHDAQLRDILITGGDALMSRDASLQLILDEVYDMALRKKTANENRPEGEKLAEMLRIRLGTRLPVYLPQRITPDLISILAGFREKASGIGFAQFVIQTHFESAMEITPEVKKAVSKLLSAGWIVTNQQVFTVAAARRGHTAKLRKVLNDIGVLTYYTFSVKGFSENKHNFATNARAMQEQIEEKAIGRIPKSFMEHFSGHPIDGNQMVKKINHLRAAAGAPFLGTDRNVLNMPGVGKSLSFRTIGITEDGRRILEFDHDPNRRHSPVIDEMGKVVIVESKSIAELIRQFDQLGEDVNEYQTLYGYSIGATEKRFPLYSYPEYDFEATDEMTNFEMEIINN
ncbi:MAG: KamA family protein [Bacteroidales bacterium]|nr:KamA family protein [Bacteroidales bacterium]